jgi:hypothetical protein
MRPFWVTQAHNTATPALQGEIQPRGRHQVDSRTDQHGTLKTAETRQQIASRLGTRKSDFQPGLAIFSGKPDSGAVHSNALPLQFKQPFHPDPGGTIHRHDLNHVVSGGRDGGDAVTQSFRHGARLDAALQGKAVPPGCLTARLRIRSISST